MTHLVLVLASPRTSQTYLVERLAALPDDVRVSLVTRVVPTDDVAAALDDVVVVAPAVPSVAAVRAANAQARAEAAAAAPETDPRPASPAPAPTGAARLAHGVRWRTNRLRITARSTASTARSKATTATTAGRFARAIRRDPRVAPLLATADIVCAVDSTATQAVWQVGRRTEVPHVLQGIPAAENVLSRERAGH